MRPRIAIPLPHSTDLKYGERAYPQYAEAVEVAGGEPVCIPLDQAPAQVMKLIERCDAVLLPGSNADVDPAKYDAPRDPKTDAADPGRDTVDELLLQDAYNMRKPVLGICYGLQILNVYRSGTLLQHIESAINHEAGRTVAVAHLVVLDPYSKLAEIVASGAKAPDSWEDEFPRLKPGASTAVSASTAGLATTAVPASTAGPAFEATEGSSSALGSSGMAAGTSGATGTFGHALSTPVEAPGFSRGNHSEKTFAASAPEGKLLIPVNSSHHQSAKIVGDGLRAVARCPDDGIIEAVEGTSPDHFVLAVQWHPERSTDDARSRAIFRALIDAAKTRHKELAGEFESVEKT